MTVLSINSMYPLPTFSYERALIAQGFRMIVGVDEVGCGALAGPVMAGAVVLPVDSRLGGIKDSKLLSAQQREALYPMIVDRAHTWAIGTASVEEILNLGLRPATLLAMRRAVEQISGADFVLVDAWKIPDVHLPQQNVIRGDRKIKSIAAASILAKVTRDRLMDKYARKFPQYGFDVHKGYATAVHRAAIKKHGPCEIHRMGYKMFQL